MADEHYNSQLPAIRQEYDRAIEEAGRRYLSEKAEIDKNSPSAETLLKIADSRLKQAAAAAKIKFSQGRTELIKNLTAAIEQEMSESRIKNSADAMSDTEIAQFMKRMKNTPVLQTDGEILSELDRRERKFFEEKNAGKNTKNK